MAEPVVNGAKIECSEATSILPGTTLPGPIASVVKTLPKGMPGTLIVLPTNKVFICNQPAATIMDYKLGQNITPFQTACKSAINPANIGASSAATATALGTPMTVLSPCTPLFFAPWQPGGVICKIGKFKILTKDCKLICGYSGIITIKDSGIKKGIQVK